MDVTSLGYATDLMILRMAGSEVTDRGTHLVVRTPANPGYWWGNFLLLPGPPDAGQAQRWVGRFAEEFPGAGHLALGVDGVRGAAGDPAEWARLGLAVDVSTVLTATSLAAPRRPAPPGTVVRALVGDEDWAQALALRMVLKDGVAEHRDFVERKQGAYREVCEAGRGAWFGAFVEGRMRAGAGVFSDGRGLARYQNVETDPGFRRRGLASSVVHAAGTWALRHFTAPTLVMAADPAYHAIHLYRTLGFTDTEPQVQLLRPTG